MVQFETQVYEREGNTIVGAEVIVIADAGEQIGRILIISETDFYALEERINSLSEEYVAYEDESALAGKTIDAILANLNEDADINATKLGGFQSDQYTKVGHTHTKENITNLYNYGISISDYNPLVGDEVTVSAQIRDSNNNPVSNQQVVVSKDNATWKTGFTNAQGVFESTFAVEEEGFVTFGIQNQKAQLFATIGDEWKTLYNTQYYTLQSKGKNMRLIVDTGSTKVSTSTNYVVRLTLSNTFARYMPDVMVGAVGANKVAYVLNDDGKLYSVYLGASTASVEHYCMLQWVL